MNRRATIALVAVLVVGTALAFEHVPAGAAEPCENLPGVTHFGDDPLADTTPVVLVHGFTGSDNTWREWIEVTIADEEQPLESSFAEELDKVSAVSVWLFDYHDTSARWVTDASIGPALADLLDCLAANGGSPAVIAAHSMGGLAARYAMSLIPDTSIVSGLVTFGTPHLGSDTASAISTGLDAVELATFGAFSLLRGTLDACDTAQTESVESSDCGWVDSLPPIGSEAGLMLASNSTALTSLPPVPGEVPYLAIAGSIDLTFQADFGFFHKDVASFQIGDGLVSVDSATAGSSSRWVRDCRVYADALAMVSGTMLSSVGVTSVISAVTQLSESGCFHSNLVHSVEFANDALFYINSIAQEQSPIVFPEWRVPNYGETKAVVYVAYGEFGTDSGLAAIDLGHQRLAEIDRDSWPGYSSLSCDRSPSGGQAMPGPDGLALGAYFDTPAQAYQFADSWERYFGQAPYGVVDAAEGFCDDGS